MPEPRGTIRVQPRYTMECETCGWRSYPYLEEDSVISEWREHVRDHLGAHIDGGDHGD